jgi:hypothetical protein
MRMAPESDLAVVRAASLEADPFSYSPVFFHGARAGMETKINTILSSLGDSSANPPKDFRESLRYVGTCDQGYRYYRLGG